MIKTINMFKIVDAVEMLYIIHIIIAISIVILVINYKNKQIFKQLNAIKIQIKDLFDDLQIKSENSSNQNLNDTTQTEELLVKCNNRIDYLDTQNNNNKEIMNKLFITNYNKTEQLKILGIDNKELKKQINIHKEQLLKNDNQIAKLSDNSSSKINKKCEEQIIKYDKQFADLNGQITKLLIINKDIIKELDSLKHNIENHTEQIKDNTEQIKDNTEQIENNTKQITTNTEQIVTNTEQIKDNTEQIDNYIVHIKTDTKPISTNIEWIANNTEQISKLQSDNLKLVSDLNNIKNDLNHVTEKNKLLLFNYKVQIDKLFVNYYTKIKQIDRFATNNNEMISNLLIEYKNKFDNIILLKDDLTNKNYIINSQVSSCLIKNNFICFDDLWINILPFNNSIKFDIINLKKIVNLKILHFDIDNYNNDTISYYEPIVELLLIVNQIEQINITGLDISQWLTVILNRVFKYNKNIINTKIMVNNKIVNIM